MANTGDNYTIELKEAQLDWGGYRNTNTRDYIPGEAYLPIPRQIAQKYDIVNSNATDRKDIYGKNLFRFHTDDNFLEGTLKAQGCNKAGDIYAKQFSVKGNLKPLGTWYDHIQATTGTRIHVKWIAPDEIELSVI
ncbi:hypothetical protein [Butyrivibrio sp. NC2002]|uniref:hypothetical protein n=1 Tax=Butyrivibrio sp. NC2002 TaxID=1410610 RepID=UPI00056D0CD8|nr:hypothetical protein [Butyrivibrio sp. NC2002]